MGRSDSSDQADAMTNTYTGDAAVDTLQPCLMCERLTRSVMCQISSESVVGAFLLRGRDQESRVSRHMYDE